MRKYFSVIIFILLSYVSIYASTVSIEAAKSLKDYNHVEIKGIVTSIPGPFENNIFFIQDGTAGINVYGNGVDFTGLKLRRNQEVIVRGMMYTHKQNREITVESLDSIILLGDGEAITPKPLMTFNVNDNDNQGMLVKTSGKILSVDFPKIFIDDGSGKTMVYIRENTGISDHFAENIYATFCGVIGKYNNEVELWPRSEEDIEITDLIPPEIVLVKVEDDNTIKIFFSEELGQFTPVLNKTVKIKDINISDFEFPGKKTLLLKTSEELPSNGEIYIKGVKDTNGNVSLLRKKTFSKYDVFVLFDEGHGQRAGNADWTINGGFSDFAGEIMKLGYNVFSINENFESEYIDNFDTLILSEPNKPYTNSEIASIESFVNNGGGLFLISDHGGADRNGNGWDAVKVFNEFTPYFLGIRFNSDDLEQFETRDIFDSPFTDNVNSIAVWNGCSIEILDKSVT